MENIIEEYILGSLLLEPKWIPIYQNDLPIDGFSTVTHQTIYRAIIFTYEHLGDVDAVTCFQTLQNWAQANRIGGIDKLYDLVQKVVETDNLPYYVKIFQEQWTRQKMGMMGLYIHQQSSNTEKPIPELVEDVYSQLGKIFKTQKRYSHSIQESLDKIQKDIENPERNIGLTSGFIEFDLLTSGFHAGELIIVAALTGMGKTCFINNIMLNIALIHDVTVLLFSLEMPHQENIKRILSAESEIPHDYLRRGFITNVDAYRRGIDTLNSTKMIVHDQSGIELSEIRQTIRKQKYNSDLGLVIVDPIQLVKPSKKTADRRDLEIGEITSGLKALAMDLEIPIIAVSHLNRATTATQTKRPELHNLKESGCVTGDTLIIRSDTGERLSIKSLAERDKQIPIPVFSMNSDYKLDVRYITKVFASGKKQVFELETRSGRKIKASANHSFFHIRGWKRLEEFREGDHIAIPRLGTALKTISDLATSDIFWDKIISITPLGIEDVYDATVEETHNFVANDIIIHNSIEQDADEVIFLHRDDYFDEGNEGGTIDVIVKKQRNGPTGTIKLNFDKSIMKFSNIL